MHPTSFNKSRHFARLKSMGFESLEELRRYLLVLRTGVEATEYDLESIVEIMRVPGLDLVSAPEDAAALKAFARALMEDVFDYCNVAWYAADLDPRHTATCRAARALRLAHPWLRSALGPGELFDYSWPTDGAVIFHALRRSPDEHMQVLYVGHLEGEDREVVPIERVAAASPPRDGWRLAVLTPGLAQAHEEPPQVDAPLMLDSGQAAIWIRGAESGPTEPIDRTRGGRD